MKKLLYGRRGASFVVFTISLVVLLLSASFVTDVGTMALDRAKLSNAVDASALAGAQELIYHSGNALNTVHGYITKNGFGTANVTAAIVENNTAVRVNATFNVPFTFARVIGINSKDIEVTAKGKVLPIVGLNSGVRPFAIQDQVLNYGSQYILKEGGGGGTTGNYDAIALGGTGAKVYYNNIVEGYDGRLMIGDYITTEPGNMSGPTEDGVEQLIGQCTHVPKCTYDHFVPGCPRIIYIVVVDTLDVNGRSSVRIKGFASFFLESVAGSGNDSEVYGRFIKTVTAGETTDSRADYGLYGVKLSN